MSSANSGNSSQSSFRDPSGSVYEADGIIYRRISKGYREDYDHLMSSGLYDDLVTGGLLVGHVEEDAAKTGSDDTYKVVRPDIIPFISYPYEWSFSQFKQACLATLEIEGRALKYGMTLKDASAYNIQFRGHLPVMIDTLSFERYREGEPWIAYRQFCQHFLASLALMSMTDIRLGALLKDNIDGIPLDLASRLLPPGTYLSFSLLSHIHIHARFQSYYSDKSVGGRVRGMKKSEFTALLDNLGKCVRGMNVKMRGSEWYNYYGRLDCPGEALSRKKELVDGYFKSVDPGIVWDIGANTGTFSRIAAKQSAVVISIDKDPYCVEKNYLDSVKNNENNVLPLLADIANPSPAIGWANRERSSLESRGPADTVLALALIHHLAISGNLPIGLIASYFDRICRSRLIVEFVPKSDPQVKKLLSSRVDIFTGYSQSAFEEEFRKYFNIERQAKLEGSGRTLYFMKKN